MGKYFVRVEKEDKPGEFDFVEVDDTKIEVPDDLVFSHPKYKEVVESDIKRRKRIKELQEQLEQVGAEKPEETEVTTPVKPTEPVQPVQPLNKDELYNEFVARLEAQRVERENAAKLEEARLQSILKQHKLPASAIDALRLSSDPEAMAVILERSPLRFDDSVGGAPSEADKDTLQANILKNLGLDGE